MLYEFGDSWQRFHEIENQNFGRICHEIINDFSL
jgi:hypothetical protein